MPWFNRKCWNEVRYRMRDAFVERGKAPTARRGEIGEINISAFMRRSDDHTVERAAVTRNEKGCFVAKKFGQHRAGIVHRRAKRAGDTQEA